MNTTEKNKLIAGFMGIIYPKLANVIVIGNCIIPENELLYHFSWDWLMPVVEKIESDERFDVNILQYGTIILCNQEEIINNVADISFDVKIEHTYTAVVEFIKWYNTQK